MSRYPSSLKATLISAALLVLLPTSGLSSTEATGTLSGHNLSLNPASGTLQILGSWEAEAFAQVDDSTGGRSFDSDAATGLYDPDSQAASAAYLSEGTGDASTSALTLDAQCSASISDTTAYASGEGHGTLYVGFEVTGGTGMVDVTISLDLTGSVGGNATDLNGTYATEVIASVEVNGSVAGQLREALTASGSPYATGPEEVVIISPLSATVPVEFGTPHFLLVEIDSECDVESQQPSVLEFVGAAPEGSVSFTIDGIDILVDTTPAMSAAQVAESARAAIAALGFEVSVSGATLSTPGNVTNAILDTNPVPAASPVVGGLIAMLLLALGAGLLARRSRTGSAAALLALAVILPARTAEARYVGADPSQCCECEDCSTLEEFSGASGISRTEGTAMQEYSAASVSDASGPSLDLVLRYQSYNADGTRVRIDSGLGYGWTHSYNVFLFGQRGHLFRMDGWGRVTKYARGPGGTFTPQAGNFETLVDLGGGVYTITSKSGTVSTFESIAGTSFAVKGPVHRLTQIQDRNGNTTTLSYTGGNLTSVSDTYGSALILGYTGDRLVSIADPLARTTTLAYDPQNRNLVQITDPESNSTLYVYNFRNQIIQKTDPDLRDFFYVHAQGKPVSLVDGKSTPIFRLQNPQNWATDPSVLASSQIRQFVPTTTTLFDGLGNASQYSYDAGGQVTQITAPDFSSRSYVYDPLLTTISSETDANGNTATYTYDADGNLLTETNALLQVTSFTYEPIFNRMTSRTDPNLRTTTFTYDGNGNRLRETDPLNNYLEWTYDANGHVLTERDKDGNVTTHTYDANGNLATTSDALANATGFTYDLVGNLLSKTDANAHTTAFTYDSLNRLTLEIDPVGNFAQYFYDGAGNRTQAIDWNGNATTFEYDERRRLIAITDALANTTTHTYDARNNVVTTTDNNGNTTTFEYDTLNRLIEKIDPELDEQHFSYDAVGNRTQRIDSNNEITNFVYDALNRLTSTQHPTGCSDQLEYDVVGACAGCTGPTIGSGLVTKRTDGDGHVTYFKYDGADRMLFRIMKEGDIADVVDGSDAVTSMVYNANDLVTTVTEPNGNSITTVYDALSRHTSVTNGAGDVFATSYDPVGNIATTTHPGGNVETNTYDALNRMTSASDSIGAVKSFTYDAAGLRQTQTNGNGETVTFVYDALNRMLTSTDVLGRVTTNTYDANGNLLTRTDRESGVTTFTYDGMNRRVTKTDPLGEVTSVSFDGEGNTVDITDANSNMTSYEYDGRNRLTKELYDDATTRTFTYDCADNPLSRTDQNGQITNYIYNDLHQLTQRDFASGPDDNYTYDLSGRLLTAERNGWTVSRTYDGADRVLTSTQNGEAVAYLYDIPNRTRTLTYPGGRSVSLERDQRGRVSVVDDLAVGPPDLATYVYDLGNRTKTRTYRNGVVTTSSYNGNGWRTLIAHDKAGQLARYGYDYDKEGNRHYEERQHDPTRSQAYQYDAANRLVNLKQGTLVGNTVPAPTTKTTWTLDGVGNWDQTVVDAVTTLRTHNNMNEVINIDGAALAYDANGNPTSDALYAYTYDGENRVATVTRKSDSRVVGTYSYDALDRRIIVIADPVSGPVETRFFYDGSSVIEEQDAATTTLATYVLSQHADDVLTMDRGGQTYYYLENDIGSSGALTNAAGNVVENYVYDGYGGVTITDGAGAAVPATAWGTAQSALDNPYRFTARRFDEETGLYHFRARTFDPGKGRFLQRDPMGYVQGVMNLYAYVDGMPTKATDPTGRVQWKIDLYDKDWPSADDHVARFFFEYDWKCKLVSKGKCEVVFTSGPRAWNTPYETQGAALTNFAIKEKEDDSCYKVRWTASGSWNEWNLWGALGGAAAGGAAVSGGVITISGGTATVNPVGWVVIAGGAVGGSIAGALTFSDDKTATLDIAWRICCECRESDGKCQKKGPTLVNKNINNSTGDLVWRTPK